MEQLIKLKEAINSEDIAQYLLTVDEDNFLLALHLLCKEQDKNTRYKITENSLAYREGMETTLEDIVQNSRAEFVVKDPRIP